MNLEQVASPEEQPKPSSEKEKVEVTPKETKDATLGKTYTEEEFKKAQSGWDKQITLSKADAQKAQTETEKLRRVMERSNASYQKLEIAHEKLIGEHDPEALDGYKRAKSQAVWEAERDRREVELAAERSDIEQSREANRLALRAFEIAQEHSVPIDELKACTTEREMELVAKLYQKPKEPETAPIIDSAISTASGGSKVYRSSELAKTEREIAKLPLVERRQANQDLLAAFKEGRVMND